MSEAKKLRSVVDLSREALNVQDACNLSGVVIAWARAIQELRALDSTYENTHFINILWADKCAQLSGCQDVGNSKVMAAYDAAYKAIGR